MTTIDARPLRVGLHRSIAPHGPEVKYVIRTLLRVAGYPYEFVWTGESGDPARVDLYYGPPSTEVPASVCIPSCGKSFSLAQELEPRRLGEDDGVGHLDFGDGDSGGQRGGIASRVDPAVLRLAGDIVFGSYWLLTGARETRYGRDRRDNLELDGSFFLRSGLAERPLVSIYGRLLRDHFARLGRVPVRPAWETAGSAGFAFTHDVDYPQIIRSIECLRLIARRGVGAFGSIAGVMTGASHFWKFSEWADFEQSLGVRPAFYFMARKGSLVQYAAGTPDAFYDITSREFAALFDYLRDNGCEIGLHASYHAHRSAAILLTERRRLEQASGASVLGNRHHYWHLDPDAPHDTLRAHEDAGLLYDSSLAFEFYPGFRRGICHPFRPFHPAERRELKVVQLPPAWMDDHFDRRLARNRIESPVAHAQRLVAAATSTGGVVVVDYHVRGMNTDMFPRWGAWLVDFVRHHLDSSVAFQSPRELVRGYLDLEDALDACSRDCTEPEPRAIPLKSDESISVDLLAPEEAGAWENYVGRHPRATIYHSLAWRRVTEEGLGHRAYYLRAVGESGEYVGVLPLFLVKGVLGRRLVSVPMRDRGGIVASSAAAGSALLERAILLTRELGCGYLDIRSFDELPGAGHGLCCERHWITTRVDLAPGRDRLWKALDRDAVRWAITKASREGVSVRADDSRPAVDTFYELFARTRRELGIPVFPKALFDAIWRHLIAPGRAALFVATKDSEPINAMICLLSNDTFMPAYAAPQRQWRKSYPSDVMLWRTMEWAIERGFRYYDFGADSPRQAGLLAFKRKWGGVQHPMYYYYFLNSRTRAPQTDSSHPGYRFLRKGWSLLPIPVTKSLGGWVTRQLS